MFYSNRRIVALSKKVLLSYPWCVLRSLTYSDKLCIIVHKLPDEQRRYGCALGGNSKTTHSHLLSKRESA